MPIVIIIVLISLIVVYTQQKDNLDVYNKDTAPSTTVATAPAIDLVPKKNKELGYTYGVPKDWTYVNSDGIDSYIHIPSETYVQFHTLPYSPQYLKTTKQSVMQQLSANNMTFGSFQWTSNSSYVLTYTQGIEENTAWYYTEMVVFDKKNAVKICFGSPIRYVERLKNEILAITSSFDWKKANPYPEGVNLYYSDFGAFEFAYPSTWPAKINGNVFLCQDPKNYTLMSITVNQGDVSYEGMTQIDYLNWASKGRQNFALQTFEMTENNVYAVASYHSNNTNMVLVQSMATTGKFEYTITFEVPLAVYQSQKSDIEMLIRLVKIY